MYLELKAGYFLAFSCPFYFSVVLIWQQFQVVKILSNLYLTNENGYPKKEKKQKLASTEKPMLITFTFLYHIQGGRKKEKAGKRRFKPLSTSGTLRGPAQSEATPTASTPWNCPTLSSYSKLSPNCSSSSVSGLTAPSKYIRSSTTFLKTHQPKTHHSTLKLPLHRQQEIKHI